MQGIEKIKRKLVEGIEKWRNEDTEDKLRRKLIGHLREKPIPDLCSYVRKFEQLVKKMKQAE